MKTDPTFWLLARASGMTAYGSAPTLVDSGFGLQAASSSRLWRASSYSTGVSLPRARWRRRRL